MTDGRGVNRPAARVGASASSRKIRIDAIGELNARMPRGNEQRSGSEPDSLAIMLGRLVYR